MNTNTNSICVISSDLVSLDGNFLFLNRQELIMKIALKYWRPLLITTLILLTAFPALAQVPRAVFTEMGSATW